MEINTIGMIIVFLLGVTLIYSASSGIYGVILLIKSFFKLLIKERSKGSFKEKLEKFGKKFFTSNIDSPITFPNGRIKTRSDVREIANAHISQFWTIDFLETTYKLHFSLAIISLLFAVIGIFYLRLIPFSLLLFIVSFFQYIAACDYKESFDKSFDSVWNAICFDVENKLARDDR